MKAMVEPSSVGVHFFTSHVVRDLPNFLSVIISLRASKVLKTMLEHLGLEIARVTKITRCHIWHFSIGEKC